LTADEGQLRRLAEWSTHGYPVTSVYLDVDGRRYPRRGDYLVRAEDLLKGAREELNGYERDQRRSLEGDLRRIHTYVREDFDRGDTRGLAVFSCSAASLWESSLERRPFRDRLVVGTRPHLLPLEALSELEDRVCTVLIDREKARVFLSSLGETREVSEVLDDVPGWHDQGGWSQGRHQRHIEDHVLRHLKHVNDVLLGLHKAGRFDHLVLAGAEEIVAALERELHDYLRRVIVARTTTPVGASVEEVRSHALRIEEELERRREEESVSRLVSEVAGETGRALAGFEDVLAGLEQGRVETLVVNSELTASGVRCGSCGHLDLQGERCALCGAEVERTTDLVEEAVEAALRKGCRVETVLDDAGLARLGGIGALLRF
jgi:peptide chain release factor subunit 1